MRRLAALVAIVGLMSACASSTSTPTQTATPFHTATLLTQTRTPTPTSAGTAAPFFSGNATIEVGDQWFLPEQVVVSVGTTILWVNRGQLAHTATARDGSFDSKNLEFGRTFTFVFTKPGRYLYFCTLHGDMIGEVDVR